MQKISDKELLLQLTGIYEVLDGFRATMNGYYDMKDEIMVPFHLALTDEQIERYSRHIILKEVGAKGQKKLLKGKVLIIGAGGLGAPAAMYLAAAGVGTIGIVDADEV